MAQVQNQGASSAPAGVKSAIGRVIRWAVIVVAALVVGAMFSASPFYTVDQGEAGVVLRFGKVVKTAEPGLGFKIPLSDQVVKMTTRTEKRVYQNLQSYSADVQEAAIRVTVNYRIQPSLAADVYAKYGRDFAERMIDPVVPKRLKEVFGQYQAQTVVNDRVRLGQEVEEAIKSSVPAEIVIESVQIENIDYSDAYEAAIEAAAQAEAEVRKSRNELERERIEADKKIVQARAQAESRRQTAQAEADAIKVRGEAEAQAIAAKAKAFVDNPGYVNLIAVERWDGKLPTTQMPGSAVPFVPVPQGAVR